MSLHDLSQIISKCHCCKRKLFSDKQIEHLYLLCVEKKHLSEVAVKFNIAESTLRRYTTNYKRRFLLNLEHYVKLLKDFPTFDISALWFREEKKTEITERIQELKK